MAQIIRTSFFENHLVNSWGWKTQDNNLVNKTCEVCFRTKQDWEKFPLSEQKSSSDLWGSYRTPFTCAAFYFLTIVDDYSHNACFFATPLGDVGCVPVKHVICYAVHVVSILLRHLLVRCWWWWWRGWGRHRFEFGECVQC